MTRFPTARSFALAVATTALVWSSSALAGGFYVSRFGGEHGNPTEGNPTSIHYNPAGLALGSGHRILIDGSIAWLSRTYIRPETAIGRYDPAQPGGGLSANEIAANSGQNNLSNIIASPFLGFVTDFGTGLPLGVGLAFYTPFGGSSVWDEVQAVDGFPGSTNGSQRWYNIDGTIRSSAISLGFAYRFESIGLSVGLAGNMYLTTIDTIRARNGDGTDDLQNPNGSLKEGRSWADATSTDFGIGVGLLWEAVEDVFWIGASYQSQPSFGRMATTGTLSNALAIAQPATNDLILTQELPDVFRLGFRWRPTYDSELRLDGNFQRWSVFDQQCLVNNTPKDSNGDGTNDFIPADNLDQVCSFQSDGTHSNPGSAAAASVIQNLNRGWENTWGVRLSGSYWVSPSVELVLGVTYDSNAVPDGALEPALPDFDKIIPSMGVQAQFNDWFSGYLYVTNVFYLSRDTTSQGAGATADGFLVPNKQPSSIGQYDSNVLVINIGLGFEFGASAEDDHHFEEPVETFDEATDVDDAVEETVDETVEEPADEAEAEGTDE